MIFYSIIIYRVGRFKITFSSTKETFKASWEKEFQSKVSSQFRSLHVVKKNDAIPIFLSTEYVAFLRHFS